MNDTGNNPSLTAAAVVVTGLIGANFAQVVMDKFGLKDPIARGMATAARFVAHPYFAYITVCLHSKGPREKRDALKNFTLDLCWLMLQCTWIGDGSLGRERTRGTAILCNCLCHHWNRQHTLVYTSSSADFAAHDSRSVLVLSTSPLHGEHPRL